MLMMADGHVMNLAKYQNIADLDPVWDKAQREATTCC